MIVLATAIYSSLTMWLLFGESDTLNVNHALRVSRSVLSSAVISAQHASATITSKKQPGAAQKSHGVGVISFMTAVGSASIVFIVQLSLFLLLRNKLFRIYQPKTYLAPRAQRTDPPPKDFVKLVANLWNFSDRELIKKCGLDAYFFLRYLKTLLIIFLPICGFVLPVLTSLNFIGGRSQQLTSDSTEKNSVQVSGLDTLAWGNVSPKHARRYGVHLAMAILVVAWTCAVFFFELRVYVKVRQDHLTSATHRLRASATTILINSIPSQWLTKQALEGLFDVYPGGVKNIWLNRDLSQLLKKIAQRDQIHLRLEAEETALIQAAKEVQLKNIKISRERIKNTVEEEVGCEGDTKTGVVFRPRYLAPWSLNKIDQQFERVADGVANGINDTIGTTNGFVQLDSVSSGVQDAKHVDRQTSNLARLPPGSWQVNKIRTLDIEMSSQDKSVAWWHFWKPPPGSYPTPIPRGCRESHAPEPSIWWQLWSKIQSLWNKEAYSYPEPFSSREENDEDAMWKKYLSKKKRKSHYLPPFGIKWFPAVPFIGQKVDTIWWCRKELARLNMEIEIDQSTAESFPLMNSAFVQFHNQTAAHMACQAEAHHIPKYMAPRMIEVSPQDIVWSNVGLSWWEEWIRATIVTCAMCLIIILWAIPMAWTAVLGQFDSMIENNQLLSFLKEDYTLGYAFRAISGIMPTAILALLIFVIPLILEVFADFKGAKTGSQRQEFIQIYYFIFLFIQLFLVVSITSFLTTSLTQLMSNVQQLQGRDILNILATNIPKGSNYFFSYLILQGLSVSSGTLFQSGTILLWYIIAPTLDRTARSKWSRNTKLNQVKWGALFPVYTNLACIGIIYCIIAPIISIFVLITFSLFWLTQRYTILYVTQFTHDTGGILYPRAINQTFTGLYVMELCVAGLFFIVEDEHGSKVCLFHGILMLVILFMTALYQILLNKSFGPLFRHLPITIEDEAIIREKAFERVEKINHDTEPEREWSPHLKKQLTNRGISAQRNSDGREQLQLRSEVDPRVMHEALYGGVETEIEDLSRVERAALVNDAFYHRALHVRRPTVWIPQDDLGITEDEIYRTKRFTDYISISSNGAFLNQRGQVVYGSPPPGISMVDSIKL